MLKIKRWEKLRAIYELLREAAYECIQGNFLTHGAALAYYTVFAIAPLFVIALAIAGFCFGEQAASRELFNQVNLLLGKQGGQTVQDMVMAADRNRHGTWATTMATITLIVAAVGMFAQLQSSLNLLWGVQTLPGSTVRNFLRHRLLSFAMVVGSGFLLLVSLVINAALSALGNFFGHYLSGKDVILEIANSLVSLSVITVLFTMIFKVLPDVKIAWRDVWLGGLVTALLFNGGKFLIGLYIAKSSMTSVYGAVGSMVIILVWVYYSSLILFFGAQLTRVYAGRFGVKPEPVRGAKFLEPQASELQNA